jgi:hypothetical protein
MPLPTNLPLGFALLLWARLAMAQNNLGELLDAGAKMLSADEFKQELVQRVIVGPTLAGGSLEVMYQTNGLIQGTGFHSKATIPQPATVSGEWTIDDNGRVCTSMRLTGGGGGGFVSGIILPPRCQLWFKYAEQYFLSDSDSDRSARVLRRTVKQ